MASLMPPPARPFRLNVHVLPSEASNNLQVQPVRRFLQVTPRTKTLQQFCDDISVKHKRQYGSPLNIKKCQVASGSDVDLEYQLSDVFEDQDVIRVIEEPPENSRGRGFRREDSLFPESSLRPKSQNGRIAQSTSVRPPSRHAEEEISRKRARSNSLGSDVQDDHEDVSNKRRKTWDPDRPIRSRERDVEENDNSLTNGNGSSIFALNELPNAYPAAADSGDEEHIHENMDSTPRNAANTFSQQSGFGSPFDLTNLTNDHPRPTGKARSGSETSSHHDDTSVQSPAQRKRRSSSKRHSLQIENPVGRGNSVSTAATTPLDSMVPNTPDRQNTSKRPGSASAKSFPFGQNSSDKLPRKDVYDDIETDVEAPPSNTSSSARKMREQNMRDEKMRKQEEDKLRTAEKQELAKQRKIEEDAAKRKLEEEEAAAQREQEEAAAQREQEAADAKRQDEERQAEEERKARIADEENRIRLERQRQEEALKEEQRQREAEKQQEAERKAEAKRVNEAEKEKKRKERAEYAARKGAEKIAKDAEEREVGLDVSNSAEKVGKNADQEREVSVADSETSKTSSELAKQQVGPSGFPPCGTKGAIWNAERDDILIAARARGEDFSAISKKYFSGLKLKRGAIGKRHSTILRFREKYTANTNQSVPQSKGQIPPPETPKTSTLVQRRESSTAPIPSTGKTITNVPAPMSSQAVATSSSPPPSDIGLDSQIPLSTKTRRSVSFAHETAPTSGQQQASQKWLTGKPSMPESKKETPVPIPAPKFSSTPLGSSFKQTKLVTPRLGITDVKATARSNTPSKLTVKPAITPSVKKPALKKQAKLVQDANSQNETTSSQPAATPTANGVKKVRSVSQSQVSTEVGSDDDSSNEIGEEENGQAERPQSSAIDEVNASWGNRASSVLSAGLNRADAARQSRSLSREQSQARDSRSPVAFMSQHATPKSSQIREGSPEVPPSDYSSSPPNIPQNNDPDSMNVDDNNDDDQDTDSDEEDDLDEMELDDAPASGELPFTNKRPEQEMDDEIQSQIRRESSQRSQSQAPQSSAMLPPPRSQRPPQASQLPSLFAMKSKALMDKSLNVNSSQSKHARFEPEEEEVEESNDESDSSESSKSDDDDEEVDLKKQARSAGAGGRKKAPTFGAIARLTRGKRA